MAQYLDVFIPGTDVRAYGIGRVVVTLKATTTPTGHIEPGRLGVVKRILDAEDAPDPRMVVTFPQLTSESPDFRAVTDFGDWDGGLYDMILPASSVHPVHIGRALTISDFIIARYA